MKMDDEKLKRLLQEEANKDAERIMEEVNQDPSLQDVVAPEAIRERLFEQIREYEASKTDNEEVKVEVDEKTEDEQELIRLGRKYKKKMNRRKYWVVAIAAVCVLAFGTISLGGPEKVFMEMKRAIGDRDQTVVNSDDGDRVKERDELTEEEAYEQIHEQFGFYPVRMGYLPRRMIFEEVVIDEAAQIVRLYYEGSQEGRITYRILTNYHTGSMGADVEDRLIEEYDRQINGVTIHVNEYFVEETKETRWKVTFEYKEAQYSIMLMGIEEKEMKKIVENLYFS